MQQFFDALKNFRAIAPSGDRITDAQRILSYMLAAITLIGAFFHTFGSAPQNSSQPTTVSDAEKPTLQELVQPIDAARIWDDSLIRNDIVQILNQSRTDSGREPLNPDFDLGSRAQKWAERNATTNSFKPTPANVVMVQAGLGYPEAKASKFLDTWFKDQASQAALADKKLTKVGVGVASSQGRTYAVVQLS
jgi:SCP-like protein